MIDGGSRDIIIGVVYHEGGTDGDIVVRHDEGAVAADGDRGGGTSGLIGGIAAHHVARVRGGGNGHGGTFQRGGRGGDASVRQSCGTGDVI